MNAPFGGFTMRKTVIAFAFAVTAGSGLAQPPGGFTPPTFAGIDTDKTGSLSKAEVGVWVATIPAGPQGAPNVDTRVRQLGREQGRLRVAGRVRRAAETSRRRRRSATWRGCSTPHALAAAAARPAAPEAAL